MADRWPAAALKAPRGLPPSGQLMLDVETAGIVQAPAGSPLNILHVLRAPLGGLFRHVVDLAQGQAARGHRVGLIVDSTTGGTRAEAALASLRLLAAQASDEASAKLPPRRAVLVAKVKDAGDVTLRPDLDDAVVRIGAPVAIDDVIAAYVDNAAISPILGPSGVSIGQTRP